MFFKTFINTRPSLNPIFQLEHTHIFRLTKLAHFDKLAPLIVAILMVGCTWWLLFNSPVYLRTASDFAIVCGWALTAATAVRSIVAGASAISREHTGQTWDALVLTGVSARQILWGKFRASLLAVLPWMFALGLFRLATIPLLSYGMVQRYIYRMCGRTTQVDSYCNIADIQILHGVIPVGMAMVIVLTLAEVVAGVAIGLGASALTRRSIPAAVLGLSVRFVPVAMFAGFARYQLGETARQWMYWTHPIFALADSASTALIMLNMPLVSWTRSRYLNSIPNALLGLSLAGLFIVGGLTLAWWRIRRDGALPAARSVATPESAQKGLPAKRYRHAIASRAAE